MRSSLRLLQNSNSRPIAKKPNRLCNLRIWFAKRVLQEPPFGVGFLLMLIAACGYATVALFGKWIALHHLPVYMILSWRFGGAALFFFILSKILKEKQQTNIIPNVTQKSGIGQGGAQDSSQAKLALKQRNLNKLRDASGLEDCGLPTQSKTDFLSHVRYTPKQFGKWACFILGLVGDVLQTTLFFFTVAEVGASIAALLLYTFPFFVFLLQRFWFKQKAQFFQWISLGLTLMGVFFIVPCNIDSINLKGLFFGLGTGVAYACYLSFGAHYAKTLPLFTASSYLTCGASVGFALLTFVMGESSLVPSVWPEWAAILGLMSIATIVPLCCLLRGLKLLGASQAALLFTLEPVITILLAVLLFRETVTSRIFVGSALILLSAIVLQKKNSGVKGEVEIN